MLLLLALIAVEVRLGSGKRLAPARLLSGISRPSPSHPTRPRWGLPLLLTKQQKESSNNFKKHFCQPTASSVCLPAFTFLHWISFARETVPSWDRRGTWAGDNAVAKHKLKCAGEGRVGVGICAAQLLRRPCSTQPAPRRGTRLRAGDSSCPAQWKIILATAPRSAGPRRAPGREGFVRLGVWPAPGGGEGAEEPWLYSGLGNLHELPESWISPGSPRQKGLRNCNRGKDGQNC